MWLLLQNTYYKTRIESSLQQALNYYNTVGQFLEKNKSTEASTLKSIFFRGQNSNGQVEFYKPYFLKWRSDYSATPNGLTRHGDIRWFPALAGAEIASRFGFEFKKGISGIRIRVPSASLIHEKVSILNQQLIVNGKDPIAFLPVKTGFVTADEALRLSVSAKGDFSALFAYYDNHSELSVHEVSWHLGAMLFPTSFHKKSRQIDQETLIVSDLIRQSGLPRADEVARFLIDERAFEIDTGNANLAATLADYRLNNYLTTFKELKKKNNPIDGITKCN